MRRGGGRRAKCVYSCTSTLQGRMSFQTSTSVKAGPRGFCSMLCRASNLLVFRIEHQFWLRPGGVWRKKRESEVSIWTPLRWTYPLQSCPGGVFFFFFLTVANAHLPSPIPLPVRGTCQPSLGVVCVSVCGGREIHKTARRGKAKFILLPNTYSISKREKDGGHRWASKNLTRNALSALTLPSGWGRLHFVFIFRKHY